MVTLKGIENINDIDLLIKSGYINNEAKLEKKGKNFESFGDSIDIAFLALSKKIGLFFNTS